MSNNKKNRISRGLYLAIIIFFLLGCLFGKLVPGLFSHIAFLGDIYVKLLKVIVIPLLMTEIAGSIYRATGSLASRIIKVIVLFVIMFTVTFLISSGILFIVKPGENVNLFGDEWTGNLASTTLSGFFSSIVSDNIISSMSQNSILPCILFAFVFGIAASKTKAEKAMEIVTEFSRVFSKILEYFMFFTPIGVFALMGSCVSNYGNALFGVAAKYIGLAWGISALIMILVMILPVWIFAHISPVTYIKKVCKIWIITLSTCSSAATLPNTVKVCNEDLGIPKEITGIVVPLGTTIHMCGGAVSFSLLSIFTLQMAGIPVTFLLFLYMLLVATLMNMAAPGIPGGGIVLGATYLTILGAPTGFIGLYSGIYRLLDMPYTTLNVTGDITANILIAESEKKNKGK